MDNKHMQNIMVPRKAKEQGARENWKLPGQDHQFTVSIFFPTSQQKPLNSSMCSVLRDKYSSILNTDEGVWGWNESPGSF